MQIHPLHGQIWARSHMFDGIFMTHPAASFFSDHQARCLRNKCTCENGEPVKGADCKTHKDHKCATCKDGIISKQRGGHGRRMVPKSKAPVDTVQDFATIHCTWVGWLSKPGWRRSPMRFVQNGPRSLGHVASAGYTCCM